MRRAQFLFLLVAAFAPLTVMGYRALRETRPPAILGVTYECNVAGRDARDPGTVDLHVTVYGAKPDNCFRSMPPRLVYIPGRGEDGATIQVEPVITRNRLSGACTGTVLYRGEGVLTKVPPGPYKLVVIGPRILSADVALPRSGRLPEGFVPTPEMEAGS